MFDETNLIGFKIETNDVEDDLLFDISFDEESVEPDNQNVVKTEIKEENFFESVVKTENEESEHSSLSDEDEDQVETTGSANMFPEVSPRVTLPLLRFNPEVQVQPISPRTFSGPSPQRTFRVPNLQKRPLLANDVQLTSQTVKGKTKVPSKLDMAKKLVQIGFPSSTDKAIQMWEEYRDMQDARKEAEELKRSERSRNPPQRYGKSYSHNATFFPKEPETYNNAIKSSEKDNWTEAMQQELKSLEETKSWDLVERPSDKNVISGKRVYKIKIKADGSLDKYMLDTLQRDSNKLRASIMEPRLLQLVNLIHSDLFFQLRRKKISRWDKWMSNQLIYIQKSRKKFTLNSHRALKSATKKEKSLSADWTSQSMAWNRPPKTGARN